MPDEFPEDISNCFSASISRKKSIVKSFFLYCTRGGIWLPNASALIILPAPKQLAQPLVHVEEHECPIELFSSLQVPGRYLIFHKVSEKPLET